MIRRLDKIVVVAITVTAITLFVGSLWILWVFVVSPKDQGPDVGQQRARVRSPCPCPASVQAHMHPSVVNTDNMADAFLWVDLCGGSHAMRVEVRYVRSDQGQATYRVDAKLNGVRDFTTEGMFVLPLMSMIEERNMIGAPDAAQEQFLDDYVTLVAARAFNHRTRGELICEERSIANAARLP